MKQVMTRAWEIAREAVNKFGGKLKEFFRQALVMAWAEAKEEKVLTVEMVREALEDYDVTVKVWEKGEHKRLYINRFWYVRGGRDYRSCGYGYFIMKGDKVGRFVEQCTSYPRSAGDRRNIQEICANL